jgi:release factor glutamine methyltransferase
VDLVARLRAAGCVFAEDEAAVLVASATDPDALASMAAARCSGVPLEQVVGWAEIAGVRVHVDPGVFVPRRRSELLVREAIALAQPEAVVVDLCCGSGALGAAVAAAVEVDLHAADLDPAAVACARRNVPTVYEGDLFDALPISLRGRIEVLLCNTPYVPTGEIPLLPGEARDHEPRVTLDGGSDGLGLQRRVAAEARPWLTHGGSLLCEVSDRQEFAAVAVFSAYDVRLVHDGDLGATVVVATMRS